MLNVTRLDACGWSSFTPELFFKDAGRKNRDVGADFIKIINEFCTGNRILELCAGGGKLIIQLARAGFQVTGIDLSTRMLEICKHEIKKEAKAVKNRIRIIQDDICTFDMGEKFDFVILEDDGFMYLLTKQDQLSCLRRVHAHLADHGLFFLSFTTPQKELDSSNDFTYDEHTQIITQNCTWTVIDEYGQQKIIQQGIERRKLTYPEELEWLLNKSELTPVARWGDLHMHPFVDPTTQEYNYLIKKQK
jgi:SAM-dependent methyltransferase